MTEKELNQIKKLWLLRYRTAIIQIRCIYDEIAENRNFLKAVGYSSTGGGTKKDLSDRLIYLEEKEEELLKEVDIMNEIKAEVREAIDALTDVYERITCVQVYICMNTLKHVAETMKYSERQVQRIHGKALHNLQIPDWYIKHWSEKMSLNVASKSDKV